MSILSLAGVTANAPFCDALDVTFPRDHADEVDAALRPFLLEAGADAVMPGLWRVPRPMKNFDEALLAGVQKIPVVKMERFGQVYRVSFSGGSVDNFRSRGVWAELLSSVWAIPHRVTRLDATIDARGESAPVLLAQLASQARVAPVKLGRKGVETGHVESMMSLDARGEMTGTVYLGKRGREIRAKGYDKRHQLETLGAVDPGPWFRFELTLRGVGATFRDAVDPSALFWNYGRGVIVPPADAPDWSTGDTGFALPPPAERDYWKILQARVESWQGLQEMALLADKLGVYGRKMLLGLIGRAIGVPQVAQAA